MPIRAKSGGNKPVMGKKPLKKFASKSKSPQPQEPQEPQQPSIHQIQLVQEKKNQLKKEQKRLEIKRSVERFFEKSKGPLERAENVAEGSDSSDDDMKNRIGNIPLEWYDEEDHIGYDIHGNKIMRKDHGDSIDQFLGRTDDPNFYRTIYDPVNDEKIILTDEELSFINRIRHGKFAHRDFDPNQDYTAPTEVQNEIMGQSFRSRAGFVPSRWEAKKVVKYIHAIRNGWLQDPRLPKKKRETEHDVTVDVWGDDYNDHGNSDKLRFFLPPHKAPLPSHAESYNPPVEYLLTANELDHEMSLDPEQRQYDFIPTKHNNLRTVPSYAQAIEERFARCMDLHLSVRQKRREKLNMNPDDLLPHLPQPKDLKPFPTQFSLDYIGHTATVRSIDLSPTGEWMVSGSEDGTVRLWEVATARCVRLWHLKEQIVSVSYNPNAALPMVAVALASGVAVLNAGTGTPLEASHVEHLLRSAPVIYKKGVSVEKSAEMATAKGISKAISKASEMSKISQWVSWWQRTIPTDEIFEAQNSQLDAQGRTTEEKVQDKLISKKRARQYDAITASREQYEDQYNEIVGDDGDIDSIKLDEDMMQVFKERYEDDEEFDTTNGLARLFIRIEGGVNHVAWHAKGDYLSTLSPTQTNRSVIIHRISAAASQLPFNKSKGLVQCALFHPTQPLYFIATQRHVLVYNLGAGKLIKTLQPVTQWISSIALHPAGNHVIVAGYDRRLSWFDIELSQLPYRTFKYHRKGIRSVAFHNRFPLWASAADDGQIHVMHATVYDDYVTNPLIVPLKILNAHHVSADGIGVTAIAFHPFQPWIFSSSADKTIRLFS